MGYEKVPWFRFTLILTYIYTLITILVLFYRPDFYNLSICVIALYILYHPHKILRNTFRWFVLAIVISIFYDLVFLGMMTSDYGVD
mmetsp:Transcript_25454/g.19202  ORF Transcript_25454/g.19202 Transcript_25454/m.19202 type:complete len:86 (-) Transcript_25454:319-576(-)